jgi:ElaB/YqjD/DUF883 family membrane-anchored ribosome-binding protein
MPADTDFASRTINTAKEHSQHMMDTAQQRTREIADSTQRYVHENPWLAMSYTSAALFGLGIIIGRLLAPERHEGSDLAAAAARATEQFTRGAQQHSQEWLDAAREKSHQFASSAQQRSRELIDSTQEYVHDHPVQAAAYTGLALVALAALVGYMASSHRDDRQH